MVSIRRPIVALALLTLAVGADALRGAIAQPDHGAVPPAASAIHVDGALEEPAWASALSFEVPYEVSPGENTPAPVRTVCLVTYDRDRLYVAFRAFDPAPKTIRAHVADRDSVVRNDYVGLVIDPFHDGRRGFEFMVNPEGVQMDATTSDVGGQSIGFNSVSLAPAEDFSWDALWASAARITADGYEVEMAIPFSSLRFPRGSGAQTWGIIAFRAWPRDVMHRLRSVPRDRSRNCYFCQAGTITGIAGVTPGRNIEIDPTLTVGRTDATGDDTGAPVVRGPVDKRLGVSARWGITPNLSLNGAVNPDFSQIEADVVQIAVNRRFALYYPEKRPFFLEGADFFVTPMRAVYSRTVADPEWGAKLTGKAGPNAIGAIVARDRETDLLFPGAQGSSSTTLEQPATVGVVRYRRDVGESSALGVLLTDREGDGYHNRVGGIDGYLRLSPRDTLRVQALRSDTRYPRAVAQEFGQPEDAFSGWSTSVIYDHNERNWNMWSSYLERSSRFRADAGFMPQVGYRSGEIGAEKVVWADGAHWFNRLRFDVNLRRMETDRGAFLFDEVYAAARYEGPLQSSLALEGARSRSSYAGIDFDNDWVELFFNFRPTGNVTASLDASYSHSFDYDNLRPGRVVNVGPGLTWNIGRHLYLQLDHSYERFTRDGDWLYRANVTQLRAVYQFDVRLFVRAILQRAVVQQNTRLYGATLTEPGTNELQGQYLLAYKVNPQTVVFLGYSDGREGSDIRERTLQNRSVFLKLGYAWVM